MPAILGVTALRAAVVLVALNFSAADKVFKDGSVAPTAADLRDTDCVAALGIPSPG